VTRRGPALLAVTIVQQIKLLRPLCSPRARDGCRKLKLLVITRPGIFKGVRFVGCPDGRRRQERVEHATEIFFGTRFAFSPTRTRRRRFFWKRLARKRFISRRKPR